MWRFLARHGITRKKTTGHAAEQERHWKTTTLIAALRVDRIDAPMTIDGALDGRSFLAYV